MSAGTVSWGYYVDDQLRSSPCPQLNSRSTAAQFIKRFVENDTPWAHLDIAGTAMGSPSTETNKSWASGFGVRLLDELVCENYES